MRYVWIPTVTVTLTLTLALAAVADEQHQVRHADGTLPLVLTAPHGATPRQQIPGVPERSGEGVEQFTTTSDTHTAQLLDAVVAELERRTGRRPYIVVAEFSRRSCDANRAPEHAYEDEDARPCYEAYHARVRAAVDAVRERWERPLLIDIHGQKRRPAVIWRGTREGRTTPGLLAGEDRLEGERGLLTLLRAAGFATWPESWEQDERPYNGGYTVATYGGHREDGIDALQLELGRDLRIPKERAVETGTALGAALADWLELHAEHFAERE